MGDLKNYGKSNRDKLLSLAKQTKGTDYNLILLLFAHDRFAARPMRDMDFLGDHISRDKENIKRIMLEICSIACEEDGVTFECESLRRYRDKHSINYR